MQVEKKEDNNRKDIRYKEREKVTGEKDNRRQKEKERNRVVMVGHKQRRDL